MLRAASRLRQPARYGAVTQLANRSFSVAASREGKFTGKLACLDLEGVLIPEVRAA